jgi:hypothetical protein
MAVSSVNVGAKTQTAGLDTSPPVPAHNPGDFIRVHVTYPSDGSGGDGGYMVQPPAGLAEIGRFKLNATTALQHEFGGFDDAGSISALTVTRTNGSAGSPIGNMTAQVEILRGVSRSTPADVRAGVAPAQSSVITYDFAAVPAGSYAVLDVATNSGFTILATPAPTPGWDIQSPAATATQDRMIRQAFASATDPAALSVTASASKYQSLLPIVYLPTASTTATASTVSSVSGDAVLFGSAGSMAAALNDADATTGVTLLGDGDSADFQMTPVITPGAGKGYRCTATVQRVGGVSGTWTWQLIEGGVVRGEVIKASTGTTPETQTIRFLNSMTSTVAAPASYWPISGPTVRVIANYT